MVVKKRDNKKNRNAKERLFLWKNRIGLSKVVVALILILLVIVAVFILWGPISRLVHRQTELAKIQEQFFSEQINIVGINFNDPFINITMRKPGGEAKASSINITLSGGGRMEADIFSVVDLSGSMRQCLSMTSSHNCTSHLLGSYSSGTCTGVPSSTMADCAFYGGIPNDKLTQAQNANKDMITTLLGFGSTRIGLIAYKNIVFSAGSIGLTNNVDVLNTTINSWQSADTTCICCGINNASWNFARQSSGEKLKSLIVMSDGEANINCSGGGNSGGSGKSDSIKAACAANSTLNNLVIYSIGVEGADEATLTAIATCGGGKYFPVANASELISTYQAIAEQIQEKFETITAIAYLYVVFYNETDDTYRERIVDVPGVLETKTYNFNLLGRLTGKIVRIEIYPVVVTPSKEEIVGPLLDSWILGGYN